MVHESRKLPHKLLYIGELYNKSMDQRRQQRKRTKALTGNDPRGITYYLSR
jgi:hypothetical protein